MVSAMIDPGHPERVALTVTVTMYLDKLLQDVLSAEVAEAIRGKAIEDLKTNPDVQAKIAAAASAKLLAMLEAKPEAQESK